MVSAMAVCVPMASIVTNAPASSSRSSSRGMAVISFDLPSTACWPSTRRCRQAQAESKGCVPTRDVAAVGKWPAGATAKSRAQAGHLSTAGVAREGVATADLRLWFEMQPLNPEHGDDDDQRQDGAAGADRE